MSVFDKERQTVAKHHKGYGMASTVASLNLREDIKFQLFEWMYNKDYCVHITDIEIVPLLPKDPNHPTKKEVEASMYNDMQLKIHYNVDQTEMFSPKILTMAQAEKLVKRFNVMKNDMANALCSKETDCFRIDAVREDVPDEVINHGFLILIIGMDNNEYTNKKLMTRNGGVQFFEFGMLNEDKDFKASKHKAMEAIAAQKMTMGQESGYYNTPDAVELLFFAGNYESAYPCPLFKKGRATNFGECSREYEAEQAITQLLMRFRPDTLILIYSQTNRIDADMPAKLNEMFRDDKAISNIYLRTQWNIAWDRIKKSCKDYVAEIDIKVANAMDTEGEVNGTWHVKEENKIIEETHS